MSGDSSCPAASRAARSSRTRPRTTRSRGSCGAPDTPGGQRRRALRLAAGRREVGSTGGDPTMRSRASVKSRLVNGRPSTARAPARAAEARVPGASSGSSTSAFSSGRVRSAPRSSSDHGSPSDGATNTRIRGGASGEGSGIAPSDGASSAIGRWDIRSRPRSSRRWSSFAPMRIVDADEPAPAGRGGAVRERTGFVTQISRRRERATGYRVMKQPSRPDRPRGQLPSFHGRWALFRVGKGRGSPGNWRILPRRPCPQGRGSSAGPR